eukprot:7196115-Pyramimonas_sp.AAC.1
MDDTWEVANMGHHGLASTAPPNIQNCAAYQVDPDNARRPPRRNIPTLYQHARDVLLHRVPHTTGRQLPLPRTRTGMRIQDAT